MWTDKDTVEFRLNNKTFPHIKSYMLSWDIFQACGSFTASIDNNYVIDIAGQPVPFEWKINGTTVMNGYLDRVEKSYSKNNFEQNIYGRDMMQVLVDNMIMFSKTYVNATVKSIIEDVATKTNSSIDKLSVVDNKGRAQLYIITPAGYVNIGKVPQGTISIPKFTIGYTQQAESAIALIPVIPELKCHYGQTLHDFISDLLNGMGLLLYHVPGTVNPAKILIHRFISNDETELTSPKSYNLDSTVATDDAWRINNYLSRDTAYNNVISASFSTDISSYYKFHRMVGSAKDQQDLSEFLDSDKPERSELIIDKIESNSTKKGFLGVTKFASSIVNTASAAVWTKMGKCLINNAFLQQNRRLYNVKYTMHGHSPYGNIPFHTNHLVVLHDEMIPILDDAMLVYAVTMKADKISGQTTELELGLPGGFNSYIANSLNKMAPGEVLIRREIEGLKQATEVGTA